MCCCLLLCLQLRRTMFLVPPGMPTTNRTYIYVQLPWCNVCNLYELHVLPPSVMSTTNMNYMCCHLVNTNTISLTKQLYNIYMYSRCWRTCKMFQIMGSKHSYQSGGDTENRRCVLLVMFYASVQIKQVV